MYLINLNTANKRERLLGKLYPQILVQVNNKQTKQKNTTKQKMYNLTLNLKPKTQNKYKHTHVITYVYVQLSNIKGNIQINKKNKY